MITDWHSRWEEALFAGNPVLQEFARARARELEITALEEGDGRIQARIRMPQGGTVHVQVALVQDSLSDWESRLAQVWQAAPETGRSLLVRLDRALPTLLARPDWPLFPRGLQDVQLRAAPPSGQEPCPYGLGVLVEVGWMIAADPWILLRLRGLSRADARRLLQGMAEGHRPVAHRDSRLLSSATAAESFWGNARALREFQPRICLGPASTPPTVTLGAPPVADVRERRLLECRLAHLYGLEVQDAP